MTPAQRIQGWPTGRKLHVRNIGFVQWTLGGKFSGELEMATKGNGFSVDEGGVKIVEIEMDKEK